MLKKMNVLFYVPGIPQEAFLAKQSSASMEETVSMLIVLAVNLQVRLIR